MAGTWKEFMENALNEEQINEASNISMHTKNILNSVKKIEKMEKSGYHETIKKLASEISNDKSMIDNNDVADKIKTVIMNQKKFWEYLKV